MSRRKMWGKFHWQTLNITVPIFNLFVWYKFDNHEYRRVFPFCALPNFVSKFNNLRTSHASWARNRISQSVSASDTVNRKVTELLDSHRLQSSNFLYKLWELDFARIFPSIWWNMTHTEKVNFAINIRSQAVPDGMRHQTSVTNGCAQYSSSQKLALQVGDCS